VKITDFPVIQLLKAQNNGEETFENAIRYATAVSTTTLATNGQNLASVAYANSLSFGAVAGASESAAGFVELATGLEAASSSLTGGTGSRLALPTTIATSTAPSSGHVIPVTGIADGNIPEGFLPTSLSQSYTFSATTTLAASTTFVGSTNVLDMGKNMQVITASTTWAVPTGVRKVYVELVGGGGGSSGCTTSSYCSGAGGSGGEYRAGWVDVSATTSVAVIVGVGGAASSNGNNSSFGNFIEAGRGNFNADYTTGSGGTLIIPPTQPYQTSSIAGCFAFPGNSYFSAPTTVVTTGGFSGVTPRGYGGGAGAGCEFNNDNAGSGGASGSAGVVILRW
jgi:hypothetical protein